MRYSIAFWCLAAIAAANANSAESPSAYCERQLIEFLSDKQHGDTGGQYDRLSVNDKAAFRKEFQKKCLQTISTSAEAIDSTDSLRDLILSSKISCADLAPTVTVRQKAVASRENSLSTEEEAFMKRFVGKQYALVAAEELCKLERFRARFTSSTAELYSLEPVIGDPMPTFMKYVRDNPPKSTTAAVLLSSLLGVLQFKEKKLKSNTAIENGLLILERTLVILETYDESKASYWSWKLSTEQDRKDFDKMIQANKDGYLMFGFETVQQLEKGTESVAKKISDMRTARSPASEAQAMERRLTMIKQRVNAVKEKFRSFPSVHETAY